MTELTKSQIDFIKRCGLTADDVFNATGLKTKEWKRLMKESGKPLAYGVTPCASGGHTLRTRAGHCAQCNSAVVAFMTRHIDDGNVYVASSRNGKFVKIGCTKNAAERVRSLIKSCYGGQSDWKLELIYECSEAGLVEKNVQRILERHAAKGVEYIHEGRGQLATELFACSVAEAKAALEKAVRGHLI